MEFIPYRLNIQLFGGEGAGDGGDGGASAGVGSAEAAVTPDAGEQRLLELGVPENVIKKRAGRKPAKTGAKAAPAAQAQSAAASAPVVQTEGGQDAAANTKPNTEEAAAKAEPPATITWEQAMEVPAIKRKMETMMRDRVRNANKAEETMNTMTPAMEVLARRFGMDLNAENMDFKALNDAIVGEKSNYEKLALQAGIPVEDYMRQDIQQRDTVRQLAQQQRTIEQQKAQNHFDDMIRQEAELKAKPGFEGFNLMKELENPVFFKLTSPNIGITVEQAYYAVHHQEIVNARTQAAAQQAARQAAESLSKSVQAGKSRPTENGTSGRAPSNTGFDYKNASRAERQALKNRINRGEVIYPGQW